VGPKTLKFLRHRSWIYRPWIYGRQLLDENSIGCRQLRRVPHATDSLCFVRDLRPAFGGGRALKLFVDDRLGYDLSVYKNGHRKKVIELSISFRSIAS
jgi:hypothetical protein